jgi:hypothetical protein
MKVRVYDQNLAKFIEMVGGHAGAVSFADTQQSLSLGVVDCAITGPSSANSAGWPEVTTHQMPLGFQMALNGYGITSRPGTGSVPTSRPSSPRPSTSSPTRSGPIRKSCSRTH